jgi:hypothetical protein
MTAILVSNFSKAFVQLFFMLLFAKFNFGLNFENQKNQFEKTKFVPRFCFKS